VADLIALVHASDLAELDIEHGSFALRVQRDAHAPTVAPVAAPAAPSPVAGPTEPAVLRSPQVGTFYLSAEPHGDPFVHEGSSVEPGQVIGLIEAMKLINEVEAEVGGVVRRVLVEDGQPVEYGQALFELE
jgi:acetyl-CoA carboxylase biotin carboxyl carrier protein